MLHHNSKFDVKLRTWDTLPSPNFVKKIAEKSLVGPAGIALMHIDFYNVVKKNAPTLADYNYDSVQSILIIFSKLFANDHKSCLVVKFSTSPHICCHYTL